MKFYCDSCGAKYLIGDEKVRGKVLRIRCKKCDHIMVVKEPSRPTSAEHRSVGDLARRLRNTGTHAAVSSAGPPPPPAPIEGIPWFYSVAGQTFGPLGLGDLAGRFAGGDLGDEAYVWNETFDAWKPGKDVPELRGYFASGAVRRPHSPTIALSAIDVQAAQHNGVSGHAAAAATHPRTESSTSSQELPVVTSILERASRTRADGKGQSALSRPASQPDISASPSPSRPTLGKRGKVATEDRLRALRERLKGGANLGSTGSLRERLKNVRKTDDAPVVEPASPFDDQLTVKGDVPSELLEALIPGPEEVTSVAVSELVEPAPDVPEAASPVPEALAAPSEVDPSELTVRDLGAEARARASVEEPVAAAVAAADEAPPGASSVDRFDLDDDDELPSLQALAAELEPSVDEPAPAPAALPVPEPLPIPEPMAVASLATVPAASTPLPESAAPVVPKLSDAVPTMSALFPEQTGQAVPSAGGLRPISAEARKAVGRDDEHSASLLIQLDTVRKSKRRAQIVAAVAGAAVLFFAVVAGGAIFVFLDDDSQTKALAEQVEEGRRRADANRVKAADVDNLKTYSKDELAELVVNLGEEDMPTPALDDPDAGVDEDAGSSEPRKVARPTAPRDKRSALDKALASSEKIKDPAGNAERPVDPKVAATGDRATVDVGAGGAHLPGVEAGGGLLAGAGGTTIEGRKKVESDKAAPAQLPASLTRADLQAGFKHIRRSAGQCLERNMKVSGPLPKSKIKVTVTIGGSGAVQAVDMDSVVKNTPFAACMNAHQGRWKFPSFSGRSMQVSKIFVLQ